MEEYDPTAPEPVKVSEYVSERPYARSQLYHMKSLGNMFEVWPPVPLQVVRYGKYHLRWERRKSQHSYYRNSGFEAFPQISIDGEEWLSFNEVAQDPTHWNKNKLKPKPDWWDKKELIAEIEAKHKIFTRNRSRMLAQKRREKLKQEAEEAGMDLAEFKAQKTKKVREKRKKRQKERAGEQMADTLNRKIKLAMALKDLADETAELREKLEDESKELDLSYIDNKVDKIRTAVHTLRRIGRERKK